jgi:hypothetical protein
MTEDDIVTYFDSIEDQMYHVQSFMTTARVDSGLFDVCLDACV